MSMYQNVKTAVSRYECCNHFLKKKQLVLFLLRFCLFAVCTCSIHTVSMKVYDSTSMCAWSQAKSVCMLLLFAPSFRCAESNSHLKFNIHISLFCSFIAKAFLFGRVSAFNGVHVFDFLFVFLSFIIVVFRRCLFIVCFPTVRLKPIQIHKETLMCSFFYVCVCILCESDSWSFYFGSHELTFRM